MALDEVLQIRLTKEEKQKIFRLAAQRTLTTGERISAGEVLRDLAITALDGSMLATPDEAGSKEDVIKFKPAPEVSLAIKRARLNSGEATDQVINKLLAEALQLEGSA